MRFRLRKRYRITIRSNNSFQGKCHSLFTGCCGFTRNDSIHSFSVPLKPAFLRATSYALSPSRPRLTASFQSQFGVSGLVEVAFLAIHIEPPKVTSELRL